MQALRDYDGTGAKPPSAAAPAGGFGREAALAGRDAGEGVFDTLMAPRDLGTSLVNLERRGISRLLGTNLPQSPLYSAQLSNALTHRALPFRRPRVKSSPLPSSRVRQAR